MSDHLTVEVEEVGDARKVTVVFSPAVEVAEVLEERRY